VESYQFNGRYVVKLKIFGEQVKQRFETNTVHNCASGTVMITQSFARMYLTQE
jgi:hypothetical protein